MHNAFFVNLQRNIMANPAAIARLAPALHRQVDEAATAPASITNGQAHLDRFRRAIDYTAHLFAGQAPQQRVMPAIVPEKPQKREAKAVPATEAPKLKAPASKRRGPKL